MAKQPGYFKLGIFVLAAIVLIILALIIWGSGFFKPEPIYFETYFGESVSGLNIGSPVELQGVRIGRVDKISFISDIYDIQQQGWDQSWEEYVYVRISVEQQYLSELEEEQREANLKRLAAKGFRVRLSSNLLTGQAYLEGTFIDPNRFPALEVPWKPNHLYVPSAPATLSTLKDSVDKILLKMEQVDIGAIVEKIESILDVTVKAVQDANIPEISFQLKNLLAEARHSNEQLYTLIQQPDPNQMINLPAVLGQLDGTLKSIQSIFADERPRISRTLESLQRGVENIEELTEYVKRYPSEIFFSQPPPVPEIRNED